MSLLDALVRKGYFPKELPPPFSTAKLADILPALPPDLANAYGKKSSKCTYHSVPKMRTFRRLLALPNPLHQIDLSRIVHEHFGTLEAFIAQSPLSLSTLSYFPSGNRALCRQRDFEDVELERALRSSASRYLLRADFSRFYPSLYTHAIAWALEGKEVAKRNQADFTLLGNRVDRAVRNTQDKQTLGLPIGPDTSDLIAEIVGAAIDHELLGELGMMAGVRYVDDYYLYFAERDQAEKALSVLDAAATSYEVEINPLKTEIRELPELLEPIWKTDLRSFTFRAETERLDLLGYFSKAFDHAARQPGSNVLRYAVKQSLSQKISHDNWPIYESFLLSSLVNESGLIPVLATILKKYADEGYQVNTDKLKDSLSVICDRHSPMRQGFEVAWSLWLCKVFAIELPERVIRLVEKVEDCIVALISLDLNAHGLTPGLDTSFWARFMTAEELYQENWLLAYEAIVKGWLHPSDGSDYVWADKFFGELARNGVEFYDSTVMIPASSAVWFEGY